MHADKLKLSQYYPTSADNNNDNCVALSTNLEVNQNNQPFFVVGGGVVGDGSCVGWGREIM